MYLSFYSIVVVVDLFQQWQGNNCCNEVTDTFVMRMSKSGNPFPSGGHKVDQRGGGNPALVIAIASCQVSPSLTSDSRMMKRVATVLKEGEVFTL